MIESTTAVRDPQAQPVLELRNISKTFGRTQALRSLSLTVRPGEIHAIVGQNGSGKSTLVKILSGFHSVDDDKASSIQVDGSRIDLKDSAVSRAAGLRFVHQDLGLIPTLDATENIALGRGYTTGFGGRIRWKPERAKAIAALAQLGYSFDVRAPVSSLAAAERTGLAVARALDNLDDVRVLVIDEPTATLPQAEVAMLFEAIRRVSGLGIGVIYVSHRLGEIFELADRVTVLRDGSHIGTYDTADLDTERLIALMLGGESVAVAQRAAETVGEVVMDVDDLCGEIVQGVVLRVRRGEILGIAGLTGSGREEILSMLFGASRRSGHVQVSGRSIPAGDPRAAVTAGVGFVPADRHGNAVFGEFTVEFNAGITDLTRHVGRLGRIRRSAERREADTWITSLNIRPNNPDAVIGNLSGGNQQKVVMARWLRMSPQVLLLDEPTQGVDVAAKSAIHRLARSAADGGAGILVASSDEDELCDICDRVLVLRDGAITGELVGDEITPERILQLHR